MVGPSLKYGNWTSILFTCSIDFDITLNGKNLLPLREQNSLLQALGNKL